MVFTTPCSRVMVTMSPFATWAISWPRTSGARGLRYHSITSLPHMPLAWTFMPASTSPSTAMPFRRWDLGGRDIAALIATNPRDMDAATQKARLFESLDESLAAAKSAEATAPQWTVFIAQRGYTLGVMGRADEARAVRDEIAVSAKVDARTTVQVFPRVAGLATQLVTYSPRWPSSVATLGSPMASTSPWSNWVIRKPFGAHWTGT